jgi:Spy/CpxP family protein refolding chaperone
MSEVTLTRDQWERVVALRRKLKVKKDKVDKVKDRALEKMGKSELIDLIRELIKE